MILSFSVSNYRSFQSEQTLSLISSGRLAARHPEHTLAIPSSPERVLRAGVIYGANGAGKSNLFKAIRYLRALAIRSRPKNSPLGRTSFRLADDSQSDSTLDLQFIEDQHVYRYGVTIDDQKVIEEWLVKISKGKEQVLFERKTGSNGETGIVLGGKLRAGTKLKSLGVVGAPANQTFLAFARTALERGDLPADILRVHHWFMRLQTISPDDRPTPIGLSLSEDQSFQKFAGGFLKGSGTGIDSLTISKDQITEEELRNRFPEEFLENVRGSDEFISEDTQRMVIGNSSGEEFLLDPKSPSHIFRLEIKASHLVNEKPYELLMSDESDGTRRLLDLLPTLHDTGKSAVYVIDEIDRSLHPLLVREFLNSFLSSAPGSSRQLVITTHDVTLLDLELLRRDEIWFADKDKNTSATCLYSLADYKVRNDLDIDKHYLQGRFGGVPLIANLPEASSEEVSQSQAYEKS